MRFGRSDEACEARALVGPLRVGALTVLTQWDLVADVVTLVYVFMRGRKKKRGVREPRVPKSSVTTAGVMC